MLGLVPIRSTSPLPLNVPTGPRNKNKYKDIDGSAPAVDGLDYGGGKERNTPPDHDEGRSSRFVVTADHTPSCSRADSNLVGNGEALLGTTTVGAQNDDEVSLILVRSLL